MRFGAREYTRIDIPAQRRGLRSRPIGTQQPRRQQRIAQMQAAVFMDQERAHDEGCLMIESAQVVERRQHPLETMHEALVSTPKIVEVPAQAHEALRSVAVGETGVKDDDLRE